PAPLDPEGRPIHVERGVASVDTKRLGEVGFGAVEVSRLASHERAVCDRFHEAGPQPERVLDVLYRARAVAHLAACGRAIVVGVGGERLEAYGLVELPERARRIALLEPREAQVVASLGEG